MQPITTRSLRHAITFVVLCTALLQAHAARLALVIGNDQYQSVDKLKNARNDATLMAGVLKKAGFDVTQASDLGRERLWSTIDTFKARLGKGDEVVFYFAGHGVQIGSNQLLLPTDIKALNESQVQRDGVPLVDIQDALKDARVAVFIIDACRDNPFPKVGTRSLGATRGLLPPEPSTGQIIMLNAGRNQKALDEVPGVRSTNGLFTWELAQVLQTPGIEIRAALEQVKEAVDDKAKRARHEQRPSLVNDLRGNFYFIAPGANVTIQQAAPPPAPRQQTADEAEQELWDSIKNANSVEALNAYLQEFPRGKFVAQARVLIAKLGTAPASPAALPQAVPVPVAPAQAPSVAAAPRAGEVFKDCDACPEMVVIPAGNFTMGSSPAEQALAKAAGVAEGPLSRENPRHTVRVRSFAAGRYAVTKGEFAAFVRARSYQTEAERGDGCFGWTGSKFEKSTSFNWRNVGFAQGDDHPVVCVSWNDAQEYAKWVSQQSGKSYRLLTEAEREYAARGGSQAAFWWGDSINTGQANYDGNYSYNDSPKGEYRQATVAANSFRPNPFGLYNMHGNVWEWVEDCFHDNYNGAPTDGSAWTTGCSGDSRVLRGGSWNNGPAGLRSAIRFRNAPDYRNILSGFGFRLARTVF